MTTAVTNQRRAGSPKRAPLSSSNGHLSRPRLRPLADRVVILPTPREELTKTGIAIPDTAKEKPQEGRVLTAGPGRFLGDGTREPIDVREGDKVLYAKYAGTEIRIDEGDFLVVSHKDILAVIED